MAKANIFRIRSGLVLLPAAFALSQTADSLYQDGLRLFAEHRPSDAIAALQQSVAMQPAAAAAWQALGVVFASQGDFDRAEAPFRNACTRQPTLAGACLYYGRTLYLL